MHFRRWVLAVAAYILAATAVCGQQLPGVGPGVPNGVCDQMLGPDCPQISGPGPVGSFTPASISGLVAGWTPDQGLVQSGGNVSSIAGAWGTPVNLSASAPNQPTVAAGLGPVNQDIVNFSGPGTNGQCFNMSSGITVSGAGSFGMAIAFRDATNITGAANRMLFGNSTASQGQIRLQSTAGNFILNLQIQTNGGGATNLTLAATVRPYKNFALVIVTYDPTLAGGTATAYVNGRLAGSVGALGAGGFIFNRVGCTNVTTSLYSGYALPAFIYNGTILSTTDVTNLTNYFAPWIGYAVYASTSGVSGNFEIWNKTKPAPSSTALTLPFQGLETVAYKPTDVFRITAPTQFGMTGVSATQRLTMDGAYAGWGLAGKAQFRGSIVPTCALVSGTIYDCGDQTGGTSTLSTIATTTLTVGGVVTGSYAVGTYLSGAGISPGTKITACLVPSPCGGGAGTYAINNSHTIAVPQVINGISAPLAFTFYIPGGTLAFGTNYSLGSMQRVPVASPITTCADLTTPSTWGIGGTKLCVNAGVALNAGDIEFTPVTSNGNITPNANANYKNISMQFMPQTSFSNSASNNVTVDGLEVYFGGNDGIDAAPGATAVWEVRNTVVAWVGIGPSGTGGANGDCYSAHAGTVAYYNVVGAWCDKEIHGHLDTATVTIDRGLSIGPLCYRLLNSGGTGIFLVTNSICISSVTGLQVSNGFVNSSDTGAYTAYFSTMYCLSAGVGNGFYQEGAGSYTSKDNIVQNCANGMRRDSGTFSSDYDNVNGNSTAYNGVTPGVHSITGNPALTTKPTGSYGAMSAFNFAIPSTSPAKGAGLPITGITTDYTGATFNPRNSIGAYN